MMFSSRGISEDFNVEFDDNKLPFLRRSADLDDTSPVLLTDAMLDMVVVVGDRFLKVVIVAHLVNGL